MAHLGQLGTTTVSLEAALAFILDPGLDPASINPTRRLQAVRGFTRYLAGIDPATEVPPAGIVSYRAPRRRPHLFTGDEITTLICVPRPAVSQALRAKP